MSVVLDIFTHARAMLLKKIKYKTRDRQLRTKILLLDIERSVLKLTTRKDSLTHRRRNITKI